MFVFIGSINKAITKIAKLANTMHTMLRPSAQEMKGNKTGQENRVQAQRRLVLAH